MDEELTLEKRLEQLREEHRILDETIKIAQKGLDQLRVARLKKEKLRLRDQINWIESQLFPDTCA